MHVAIWRNSDSAQCCSAPLRRVNREGYWQRVLLTYLGFYPYECVNCRKRTLLHDDGQQVRRTPPRLAAR